MLTSFLVGLALGALAYALAVELIDAIREVRANRIAAQQRAWRERAPLNTKAIQRLVVRRVASHELN